MTQIVVNLEHGADTSLLQRMIENMKGVLNTTLHRIDSHNIQDKEVKEWIETLHKAKSRINPELIDMDDERTRYLMSK